MWRQYYSDTRGEDFAKLDLRFMSMQLIRQICELEKLTTRNVNKIIHDSYCVNTSWSGRGEVCQYAKHLAMYRPMAQAAIFATKQCTAVIDLVETNEI
jgi:hypothetical protein